MLEEIDVTCPNFLRTTWKNNEEKVIKSTIEKLAAWSFEKVYDNDEFWERICEDLKVPSRTIARKFEESEANSESWFVQVRKDIAQRKLNEVFGDGPRLLEQVNQIVKGFPDTVPNDFDRHELIQSFADIYSGQFELKSSNRRRLIYGIPCLVSIIIFIIGGLVLLASQVGGAIIMGISGFFAFLTCVGFSAEIQDKNKNLNY